MMGAGDWVAGGLHRAAAGLRSALPGGSAPVEEPTAQAGSVAEDAPAVQQTPAKAAPAKAARSEPAPAKDVRREAAPAKAAPAKAAPAKSAPAKSAPAKDVQSEPAPAKSAPAQNVQSEPALAKAAPAQTAPEQKAPAQKAPADPTPPAEPAWSDDELVAFRVALEADVVRLREELHMGEADMDALLSDSAERAGDDQADAGAKTLEREQEMSVYANAHELLEQSLHALARLDAGTYGICESCATSIPAARLRAFPRATLCIRCKQAEERR